MNNKLKIVNKEINDNKEETIDGRILHKELKSTEAYPIWASRQIKEFEENFDYISTEVHLSRGKIGITHYFTIDIAKHICLMSRTKRGKEFRQDIINYEKDSKIILKKLQRNNELLSKKIQQIQFMIPENKKLIKTLNSIVLGDPSEIDKNVIYRQFQKEMKKLRNFFLKSFIKENSTKLPSTQT